VASAVHVASRAEAAPVEDDLAEDLGTLYAQHFTTVWRSLRRLGVPEASLEDAAQDVFLVVHRRRHEFAGRSAVTTWLYGIALRVAKDYRRSESRRQVRLARLAGEESMRQGSGDCPATATERSEANQVLHAALGELPDEQRELFVLLVLEEVPMRIAANILGLGLRTAQRRARAAQIGFEKAVDRRLVPPGRAR
jgi:RNA polymerase sigma-70 factor (ECF subfamily)